MSAQSYEAFLERRRHSRSIGGFVPLVMPEFLFDFQRALLEWSLRQGRCAVFADCGLGKTPMQLVWAENVARHTGGRVLILAPLSVAQQTVHEGEKFGIEVHRSRTGENLGPITITNYERLHHFDPSDFVGLVCDESSILKHFSGETQKAVTSFACKLPYRSLWTATAAPNDYIELGTSSEALGELGYSDMLARFFRQTDGKGHRMQQIKDERREKFAGMAANGDKSYFQKLAFRVSQQIGQWRLKGHAEEPFWRWVCSWARACRKPSDLGFSDDGFVLPELIVREHVVDAAQPAPGMLFVTPALGLQEEREERRRTLRERCERVAELVSGDTSAVVWCHLNVEGDMLARLIPGAVQVKGGDSDEAKEEAYDGFASGQVRVLVTKPKIGAWGLNWQHCNHVVTFASHSYEQYYQSVRRCWRFGQRRPVTVDVISTEGEVKVRESLERKARAADEMFSRMVAHMNASLSVRSDHGAETHTEVPEWLSRIN